MQAKEKKDKDHLSPCLSNLHLSLARMCVFGQFLGNIFWENWEAEFLGFQMVFWEAEFRPRADQIKLNCRAYWRLYLKAGDYV